jgi:hypothetical protein
MTSRRRLAIPALVIAGLGVSWWLFGFNTHQFGESSITSHRFLGRVTRIDSVVVAGGRAVRTRQIYPWAEPFVNGDPMTDCAAICPESWQDRNGDGRWDTWIYRVGPDGAGQCQVEYRVDSKGAGQPDWVFRLPAGQFEKANLMIKERRGF